MPKKGAITGTMPSRKPRDTLPPSAATLPSSTSATRGARSLPNHRIMRGLVAIASGRRR
jgi:hypothetical protein